MLQVQEIGLERDLLGSIVDFLHPVETIGQEVDQFVDYSFTDSDFNHTWGE